MEYKKVSGGSKRGGARKGAGRPKVHDEPRVMIRVRRSTHDKWKQLKTAKNFLSDSDLADYLLRLAAAVESRYSKFPFCVVLEGYHNNLERTQFNDQLCYHAKLDSPSEYCNVD